MPAKTEDAARAAKPAGRASGRGRARAGTGKQLSRADRKARGKDARAAAPLESQAEFGTARSRDPVGLLLEQEKSRVPELLPVRHGRMLVSPFTFFRGAALPMAADLATTPTSGLRVQLCGDAHLANFGAFASPRGGWCLTSTTSTRPCPVRSSGMSSGWRPAWPWPGGITGSPPRPAARSSSRGPRATGQRCAPSRSSLSWRCGMPTWTSMTRSRSTGHSSRRPGSRPPRSWSPRPTPTTACRRSASSPPRSTGSGGSSATPR